MNNRKTTRGRKVRYSSSTSTIKKIKLPNGKNKKVIEDKYDTVKEDKGFHKYKSIIHTEPVEGGVSTVPRKEGNGKYKEFIITSRAGSLIKRRERTFKQRTI